MSTHHAPEPMAMHCQAVGHAVNQYYLSICWVPGIVWQQEGSLSLGISLSRGQPLPHLVNGSDGDRSSLVQLTS